MRASVKQQLAKAPDRPGVYLFRDGEGGVLYVGKAKSLAKRLGSYRSRDADARIAMMLDRVRALDYIVTGNEVEALILENTLIKRHRPPFNVSYRDDKSYPFIAVTTGDRFPRIVYTREKHRPETRYFGPYTDARAARETIDMLRRVFPLRTCRGHEPGKSTGTPCLMYHIERCPGPCIGAVSEEDYASIVDQVVAFLGGRESQVLDEIADRMRAAAEELQFEKAARLRNRIRAAERILARQKVVGGDDLDADVVGLAKEEGIAVVELFQVRRGALVASDAFVLDKGDEVPVGELVRSWMLRYYSESSHVPGAVLVGVDLPDAGALEEWLSGLRAASGVRGRTRVARPQRGEKAQLRAMADENARQSLTRFAARVRLDETRANKALSELVEALGLGALPYRIECFDISDIMGKQAVGSMVVFVGGLAAKNQYRRFRVRLSDEPNDVAMMAEVLRRRFSRRGRGSGAPRPGSGFAVSEPDLVIVDGGLPQLGAARNVLAELGIEGVASAALAKREEELYVVGRPDAIRLAPGSEGLHLVKRIRDEAHRFALAYHRELRGKAMTRSVLDDIPGVGPKTKRKLLRHLGSLARIKKAGVDELRAAGITAAQAEAVRESMAALAPNENEEPPPTP